MILALVLKVSIVAILLLITKLGIYLWKNKRLLTFARKLPSPVPTLPLLGHLHYALLNIDDFVMKFVIKNVIVKAFQQRVDNFCLWLGFVPAIFIQSPDDVQTILNSPKCLDKGPVYDLLDFLIKEDLFTAKPEVWKPLRRVLTPLTCPKNVDLLIPSFNNQGRNLVSFLSEQNQRTPVDCFPKVYELTASSALDLVAGDDVQYKDRASVVSSVVDFTVGGYNLWFLRLQYHWIFIELTTVFHFIFKQAINRLKKLAALVEDPALKVFQDKKKSGTVYTKDIESTTCPITLMDLYLSVDPSLDKSNIFDEKNFRTQYSFMLSAVADSTTIALANCLLSLSLYPEEQEKLYNELVALGLSDSKKEELTPDDIRRVKYLDQFIMETMRIFVTVPLISRNVTEDLKLSFGTIPANTTVYLPLEGIHMNPHIYETPTKFDPSRFVDDEVEKRHKYSYLPFGGGTRTCFGKDYAYVLIKTTLVHVIRNLRLSTVEKLEDVEFKFRILPKKKNGYLISAEKRV